MFRSRIRRRAPLALVLAATAAIAAQAVGSASSVTPTYSPLVFTSTVQPRVVEGGSVGNVTYTGTGAAPAALAGTLATQITGAAGTLSGGYAIQLATTALGSVSTMTANVTLVGLDAQNNVVASDSRDITTFGSGATAQQAVGYAFSTGALAGKVSSWELIVNGYVTLASTPGAYYAFAGSDATPAIN